MNNLSFLYTQFQQRFLNRWRTNTTQILAPATEVLQKLHVRANHLTTLALLMSIFAIIFFDSHTLFTTFIILHLVFDIVDGSLARREGPTQFGKWFDYLSDSSLVILLGLRLFAEKQSFIILAMLIVYILHHSIYIIKKMHGPIMYGRTILALAFVFTVYTLGIWIVLVISLLGIIAQVWYGLRGK